MNPMPMNEPVTPPQFHTLRDILERTASARGLAEMSWKKKDHDLQVVRARNLTLEQRVAEAERRFSEAEAESRRLRAMMAHHPGVRAEPVRWCARLRMGERGT